MKRPEKAGGVGGGSRCTGALGGKVKGSRRGDGQVGGAAQFCCFQDAFSLEGEISIGFVYKTMYRGFFHGCFYI